MRYRIFKKWYRVHTFHIPLNSKSQNFKVQPNSKIADPIALTFGCEALENKTIADDFLKEKQLILFCLLC